MKKILILIAALLIGMASLYFYTTKSAVPENTPQSSREVSLNDLDGEARNWVESKINKGIYNLNYSKWEKGKTFGTLVYILNEDKKSIPYETLTYNVRREQNKLQVYFNSEPAVNDGDVKNKFILYIETTYMPESIEFFLNNKRVLSVPAETIGSPFED